MSSTNGTPQYNVDAALRNIRPTVVVRGKPYPMADLPVVTRLVQERRFELVGNEINALHAKDAWDEGDEQRFTELFREFKLIKVGLCIEGMEEEVALSLTEREEDALQAALVDWKAKEIGAEELLKNWAPATEEQPEPQLEKPAGSAEVA